MAFTRFNQHQSILSILIFIEIRPAAAAGRVFTHQRILTWSHITGGPLTGSGASQSPSPPLRVRSRTRHLLVNPNSGRRCRVLNSELAFTERLWRSLFHFLSSQGFVESGTTSLRPVWVLSAAQFAFQRPHAHALVHTCPTPA